jgi:hypothetical protein
MEGVDDAVIDGNPVGAYEVNSDGLPRWSSEE